MGRVNKFKGKETTPERQATRRVMREREIDPSYGMGQNFMTDRAIASWIVDQLDIRPGDTVIEIGPGMGALTEHLVTRGAQRIILIDGAELTRLMIRYGVGVRTERTIELRRLDLDYFEEVDA
jgi:hypothetical protein